MDLFNKLQKKHEIKFELNKEALNVTKKYVLNLENTELSLDDPLNLLIKIKSLCLNNIKYNLRIDDFNKRTKQQFTLECLMKKTNFSTGEETIDKAHFHSYYEEIYKGTNLDETYEKMVVNGDFIKI